MKAAWVHAERESEVREAARAWRHAGKIDAEVLAAIKSLFPAPWPEPSLLWGILALFFASFAVVGIFAAAVSAWHAVPAIGLFLAALLAVAADRLRPAAAAAAAATGAAAAFWTVVCLLVATGDAAGWGESSLTPVLIIGAAAWTAAAWRWGYQAFAAFGTAFAFLFLARFGSGRLLWLGAAAALAAVAAPALDRPALAPSHRRCAAAVLSIALVAAYVALNRYSLDHRIVESVGPGRQGPAPGGAARALAAVATAAFPLLVFAWGVRGRRTLLLDLSIVFAALSVATLRFYVRIAPLWAILAVSGAGLVLLALGVHRWLSRSPGRRRGGLTADALFEDEERQQAAAAGAAALTLGPEPTSPAPAGPGAFRGGDGSSGGAGSGGSF